MKKVLTLGVGNAQVDALDCKAEGTVRQVLRKKIIQLGANAFQATTIKAAKRLGCHVITVDYLPDNPGYAFLPS